MQTAAYSENYGPLSSDLLRHDDEKVLLRRFHTVKQYLRKLLEIALDDPMSVADRKNPLAVAGFIASKLPCRRWRDRRIVKTAGEYEFLKDRLASANVRLASHVAKRFGHHGIGYEDLFHEAICGLLHAIDRFDINHKTRLATYATWWIRQSLQIAVARQSHLVTLSPHHVQQLGKWQQEIEAKAHDEGRLGSAFTLASKGPAEAAQLLRLQRVARSTSSLDVVSGTTSDFTVGEVLVPKDGLDMIIHGDACELLKQAFARLQAKEKTVIALRFGLTGEISLNMREIGFVLKVTNERVRQIKNTAIVKMQAFFEEQGLDAADMLTGLRQ